MTPSFFRLNQSLLSLGNYPTVLGGDWNAVYSGLPVDINPDCINMTVPLNPRHTGLISDLCLNFNLVDPFRSLHPFEKQFSFVPRAPDAVNRSRIDFFLVSNDLLGSCEDCFIADSLQSSMFDHKAVTISFLGPKNKTPNNAISCKTIKDPDCDLLVKLSTLECYLIYQNRDRPLKNQLLLTLGRSRAKLREAGPDKNFYGLDYVDTLELERRNTLLAEINDMLGSDDISGIPDVDINIEADLFFEMILNHVRNDLLSYQIFLNRYCFKEKRELSSRLKLLYIDVTGNFRKFVKSRGSCYGFLNKKLRPPLNYTLSVNIYMAKN
jgi:hypothetical protein